jgi:hypothetical protein
MRDVHKYDGLSSSINTQNILGSARKKNKKQNTHTHTYTHTYQTIVGIADHIAEAHYSLQIAHIQTVDTQTILELCIVLFGAEPLRGIMRETRGHNHTRSSTQKLSGDRSERSKEEHADRREREIG